MKIVVNTRLLLPGKLDGIGWFTYETLLRITRDHPEHDFHFLFDRPWDDSFVFAQNVHPHVIRPQARHPFLWHLWFQRGVRHFLRQHPADLFFSPDGFIPLHCRIKTVPVLHDINFVHYPKDLPPVTGAYYRKYFPLFARQASHLVTVSEFSKKDISGQFGIPPEKISVAWNGVSDTFSPLTQKEKEESRQRFGGGAPYFVHVGSLLPRKNIPRLLRAYDLFRKQNPSDIKMVIAGREMFGNRELWKVLKNMEYGKDVLFPGGLDRQGTRMLIGGAEALVFVSYFEGFGIPLVEAMACHTPLVAAKATAIPEVAGEAALYTDPFSEKEIAAALGKITSDTALREKLIRTGAERVKKFSWDDTAEKIWQVIQKTVRS
jgi:glycosyltransferase involved in cell wall biosynthesis